MIKSHFEKIRSMLSAFDQKNRIILFFMSGFLLVGYSKMQTHSAKTPSESFKIDTIIPNGYVLIPIQLSNAQAISNVIGKHGVADIYSTSQGQKSKRLFSRAKIIKSSIDETVFSILVKESRAHLLSQSDNPFFAAVQNPKAKAIETEIPSRITSGIKIIYQN